MNTDLTKRAIEAFARQYGRPHAVAAFAPGRIEVLGNHTDYNEGFVLSAAIPNGTVFLAAPAEGPACRLTAGDLMETVSFSAERPAPLRGWANYVIGVSAGLQRHGASMRGFDGLFLGDVPMGAGLSSSAALEISAALALDRLYRLELPPLTLARIGQQAEHDFAGVQCGIMDQITSLFGQPDQLVLTDFRSLEVNTVALGPAAAFLMCRTHARHALVDGEYNARRRHCEEAAQAFATLLPQPVRTLRDVSWADWETHHARLPPLAARRSAHPIGENERVLAAGPLLAAGDLQGFGALMYASHDSSVRYFENSCPELDSLVDAARTIPGVHGARLSGGGFGGSVVVLVSPDQAEGAAAALREAYRRAWDRPCDIRLVQPAAGARIL